VAYKDRHNDIINILTRLKKVSVQDLTERLNVSEVTIRKDLTQLEEKGKLLRTHGGAVLAEDREHLRTLSTRLHEKVPHKRAIASRARELVREDDTIYIDSGSTCYFLAREVKGMTLRVVTNSIDVMAELAPSATISLYSLGGSFRPEAGAFIGPVAEEALRFFQIETCFLGTTGISPEGLFSSQNTIEAQLKRKVRGASQRAAVLADHTKYGIKAFAVFSDALGIDILVTDEAFGGISELESRGLEVILAH
jgi:DeoR/GlpR family transcriptional regulator of sugar metabolism